MAVSMEMLAAFVKVAEASSVSAAALDLGVGKSVISKRIAQLEQALGATLFARSTRSIVLTPAGDAFLDHARRALGEWAAAEERLRALRSELTGCIRVSSTVSWGQRVLARLVPEFLNEHHGITVDLQLSDQMIDIAHARVDLAMRWSSTQAQGLVTEPVAQVQWALVATPAYLARYGVPVTPQDLALHQTLHYWRDASDDLWTLQRGEQHEKVKVRSRYHVNTPEGVAYAALADLGIAQLPDYLAGEALADGRLQQVLRDWSVLTKFGSQISAVATPERMRLARNQVFLEFVRRRVG